MAIPELFKVYKKWQRKWIHDGSLPLDAGFLSDFKSFKAAIRAMLTRDPTLNGAS